MVGAHPKLRALSGAQEVLSSHVDLMPTILDLAGIRAATSAVGHSLLRKRPAGSAYSYACHERDLVLEQGDWRSLLPYPGEQRPDGDQLFNTIDDFHEDGSGRADSPAQQKILERHRRLSTQIHALTTHALVTNRVAPQSPK